MLKIIRFVARARYDTFPTVLSSDFLFCSDWPEVDFLYK